MPRFLSLVTTFAAEGSERGPTNTLRTPFTGAMYEMCWPSGEMRACAFSGLPNRADRGITALPATASAGVGLACAEATEARSEATARTRVAFMGISPAARAAGLRPIISARRAAAFPLRSGVAFEGPVEIRYLSR